MIGEDVLVVGEMVYFGEDLFIFIWYILVKDFGEDVGLISLIFVDGLLGIGFVF